LRCIAAIASKKQLVEMYYLEIGSSQTMRHHDRFEQVLRRENSSVSRRQQSFKI
jgi:hypothetical protein